MTEDYVRRLKRRTLIALVATLISLALLAGATFWLRCSLFGPRESLPTGSSSPAAQRMGVQVCRSIPTDMVMELLPVPAGLPD